MAAAAVALTAGAGAQVISPVAVESGARTFTIFLRGQPIGSEQITVTRSAEGWSINSAGRLGAPIDAVGRRLQVRYTADWQPIELTFDATVRGQQQSVHTTVAGGTAKSDIVVNGVTSQKSDAIDPSAVLLLPNSFFAPFEALATRLRSAAAGSDIPLYQVSATAIVARVGESATDAIQTTARVVSTKRTRITLVLPAMPELTADLWSDEAGRLVRLSVPAQSLEVVREDIAAVSSRSVPISRPNDELIRIPGGGFILAGTLSKPMPAPAGKLPAVVLIGGSGTADRDAMAYGIPILGQIAGALADAGFIVVRYDKRGIGQSGGRPESAALADYAEDLRAAIKALAQRKDVDPKRIGVVGHSEGGVVALIAASKDHRIASVALLSTPGVSGAELVLAQQRHLLDRSNMTEVEKRDKVELQKRIHQAVITGKGLDQFPAEVRRAVDNAEFQSLLVADPAKIMPNVKQPVLIVQGELDTQVEPQNADKLGALARQRKRPAPAEVVKVPRVNHLLAPATTGELDEYARLTDLHVSAAVTQALVAWMKKTL